MAMALLCNISHNLFYLTCFIWFSTLFDYFILYLISNFIWLRCTRFDYSKRKFFWFGRECCKFVLLFAGSRKPQKFITTSIKCSAMPTTTDSVRLRTCYRLNYQSCLCWWFKKNGYMFLSHQSKSTFDENQLQQEKKIFQLNKQRN